MKMLLILCLFLGGCYPAYHPPSYVFVKDTVYVPQPVPYYILPSPPPAKPEPKKKTTKETTTFKFIPNYGR
jgi:hypothetical protein